MISGLLRWQRLDVQQVTISGSYGGDGQMSAYVTRYATTRLITCSDLGLYEPTIADWQYGPRYRRAQVQATSGLIARTCLV